MALACVSVGHCLRGSEAGGGVGQEDEGVRFFGTKSRRGVQRQEVGPWVREWLQLLAKLRALKGFHPDRGAWHESREALGKTLVGLLERGEGKKTVRWHSFRRMGAAQLRKMGAPLTTILLWGGWKSAKVAQMYTEAPPQVEVCPLGKNPMAHVGGGGAEPGYCAKQGSTLSFWPSWIRREIAFAAGEASRLAGGSPEGGENARKRGRTVSPSASAARTVARCGEGDKRNAGRQGAQARDGA